MSTIYSCKNCGGNILDLAELRLFLPAKDGGE